MPPAPFTRLSLYGLLALAPLALHAQSVRQLGDSELSCAQIYAESQALEKSGEAQQAASLQAQQAMTEIQNQMMKQAGDTRGGMGSAIGSGLLGLIPGAGQLQGYALQAAADARRANMQDSVDQMMVAQTQLMNAEQALERTQARSEHLADLFLKKDCRLSQVKAGADRPQ